MTANLHFIAGLLQHEPTASLFTFEGERIGSESLYASNSLRRDCSAPLECRCRQGGRPDWACGNRRLPIGQRSPLRRPDRSRRTSRKSDSPSDYRRVFRSDRGGCRRLALYGDLHSQRIPGPERRCVDPTLWNCDRAISAPRATSSANRLELTNQHKDGRFSAWPDGSLRLV